MGIHTAIRKISVGGHSKSRHNIDCDCLNCDVRRIVRTCSNHNFVHITCFNDHTFPVVIPCGDCPGCFYSYQKKLMGKILERAELRHRENFYLWTFGSDLELTDDNETLMKTWWKKLCTRLATYSKREFCPEDDIDCINDYLLYGNCMWHLHDYDPLLRVIEIGSKGKKLHYHVIYGSFMPHNRMLSEWRNITGMDSNVNFTYSKYGMSRFKAGWYVAKYVSKNRLLLNHTRSYSFMGRWRSIPPPLPKSKMCQVTGCDSYRYVREYTYF